MAGYIAKDEAAVTYDLTCQAKVERAPGFQAERVRDGGRLNYERELNTG